mgnify:FL=1
MTYHIGLIGLTIFPLLSKRNPLERLSISCHNSFKEQHILNSPNGFSPHYVINNSQRSAAYKKAITNTFRIVLTLRGGTIVLSPFTTQHPLPCARLRLQNLFSESDQALRCYKSYSQPQRVPMLHLALSNFSLLLSYS